MTAPPAAGTASELVASVEATSPDVVRLATLVSVAARIEPGLLRRARLTLAADLPTASEARLWFSPLVAARTTSAIALDAEAAAVLREGLAADPELRDRALDVVEWAHRDKVPPTIQLEEDVIRAAITGAGEGELSALLARALATMAEPGREQGIARWAARAVPGLPALARDSSAGYLLMAGASARLRLPVPIEPDAGPAADLASVIPPGSPHIDVGLRLLRQGLEISEPPAETALTFSVPDTDPLVLRVQASGDAPERVLTVGRGTVERHRLGASPFTPPASYEVTAVDGQVARLEPAARVLEAPDAPDRATEPPAVDAPQSLTEMIELVRRAEVAGTTVHALTARRDAGFEPMSYLGESALFRGRLELDDGTLRGRSEGLVRVLAGTRLEDLCADLDRSGLALATMPPDMTQTVGELIGSSAHGSGPELPPFCDLVRSLDVVGSGGEVIRIEPRDGVTDPERFVARYASRRLTQDDETFWAAVCGLGAIGLVHSVVLDVVPGYQLRRVASLTTWEELRESRLTEELLRTARHVEIVLDPYPRPDGRHVAVLTRGEQVEVDQRRDVSSPRQVGTQRLLLTIPWIKPMFRLAARFAPGFLARSLPRSLRRLPSDYVGWWYAVLADPLAGLLPAFSSELAIGTDEGRWLFAVDRVLDTAAVLRTEENLIHTAPIVLRFTGPSRAFASMMQGRPTMTIELPLVDGTRRGHHLLDVHARDLERFGARPHWAKHARTIEPRTLYPRWDDWLRVESTINESGAFDSPLTERLGIRRRRGRYDPPATTKRPVA